MGVSDDDLTVEYRLRLDAAVPKALGLVNAERQRRQQQPGEPALPTKTLVLDDLGDDAPWAALWLAIFVNTLAEQLEPLGFDFDGYLTTIGARAALKPYDEPEEGR